MTPNKIRNQLENALDLLVYKNISIDTQFVHRIRNRDWLTISWRKSSQTDTKPYNFGSFGQYRSILKDNSYSCVLEDGSILRLSYTFHRTTLFSHNLWYYPCPFNIPVEEIRTNPIIDLVEMYANHGIQYCNFKGPIRFDYDSSRVHAVKHPASHAHLFDSECRIPVKAPISPGTFLKFIFCNFYPNIWDKYEFIQKLREEYFDTSLIADEHKQIHLSWFR